MTGLERAKTYAAIFIGAGDGWTYYVPIDAVRVGPNALILQDVRMERRGNAWWLSVDGQTLVVRSKVEKVR